MTANRSQYMILDADNSDMERRGRRNCAYSRGPALPLIRNQHSPDRSTLEEIAREQHPDDSPRETRQRVQLMQRHLEEDRYRVTYRSERHEVVFDPVETSTPPVVAPSTPTPAAATETRPAWVIKLEQDLAAIQQQEQQQQQAAQLAQQQTVTVEEVEDDEPLSYTETTPQPLTEVPAFPGHYQIEFPGEQIEGETNSDVSEIEEHNSFLVPPRDTRPSGFAMPPPPRKFTPLPPRQFTPPPVHIQPFPEPRFRSWLADNNKKKELLNELDTNAPLIASQLDMYLRLKNLQSTTMSTRLGIIDLKKQMKEEAEREMKRRDMQIDQFGERLQKQQLLFDEFTSNLLASIPHNELRLNAPKFFQTHADTTNMDEGLRPITYEEFKEKAPTQMHLFYSQGRARYGVYKQSKLKFYSKNIPHEQYRERKCQQCLFYGHHQWDCPEYVCPRCKRNCGNRKEDCTAPRRNFDMVVMMANTSELTPEPQDFPPVASTSLLEPTSSISEGAHHMTDPAINSTVTKMTIYRSIRIFEQF